MGHRHQHLYTGDVLGSVPEAGDADVDAAIDAARRAFDEPGGWAS
jgi:acyl-CoA reductase-like NAD-dependent aldehyde dehydrogenase